MQRDALLLAEMIDAVERIIEVVDGKSASDFDSNHDARDALLWNFTVLGEAASQVSQELKDAYPGLPWSDPVRLRNRIVHGYWSIELDVLTSTAQDDLPALLAEARRIAAGL